MGHHDAASASSYRSSSQLPLLLSSTNCTSASLNFKPRMNGGEGQDGSDLKLSYVEQRHRRLIRYCSSKQQQLAYSQLTAAVLAFKWKLGLFLGIFGDYDRRRRKRRVARIAKAMVSALIFAAIGVGVPVLNSLVVKCSDCASSKQMPFQKLLDVSECTLCAISALCLIYLLRKYGLRHFFLVDHVCIESRKVQEGYLAELKGIFLVLPKILLPFFIVELVHSILWFRDATVSSLPLLAHQTERKVIMCILSMASWTYNNAMFLLMVLLFKLVCSLQLLRLQDYYRLLQRQQIDDRSGPNGDTEEGGAGGVRQPTSVLLILQEHIRLREQLLLISHRFRVFVVMMLFAVTLSQFAILFQVTASGGTVNFRRTGDLVVCCSLQLVGVILCLRAAAKITHMAQRIVAVVSQWHAVSSCASDQDIIIQRQLLPQINPNPDTTDSPPHDGEESGDEPVKPSDDKPNFSFNNLNESQHTEGDNDQYALLEPSGHNPGRFRRAVWPFLFINRLVSSGGAALSGSESPVAVHNFDAVEEESDSIYGDSEDQSIEDESDLRAALQLFQSTKDSLAGADSFHKRHALVTYLQHCSTGISLYGFVLDRGCLYTIFALELTLVLWTLGKTLILSSS